MSQIKSKNTKPELLLRSLLHQHGYRFRLHVKNLPGKPDIVLPRHKVVILVNGCFWHRHKDCKYASVPKKNSLLWKAKFEATINRDIKQQQQLKDMGWNVLIAWECNINKNPELILNELNILTKQTKKDFVNEN